MESAASSSVHPETTREFTGWRFHYPFASHYLAQPAGRMHYVDEGRGEPILMVHGNPSWSFLYRQVIQSLRPLFRCVAPDHIGCGLSDKPQNFSYRLKDHIDHLENLMTTLDLQNITLMVHDWGGAIGMGAALRQPDRIKRIIAMNTAAFPSTRIPFRIAVCRWPILGPLAVRGGNLFARAALRMAVANPDHMSPTIAQGFLHPYNSWANRVAIQRFVEDIPIPDEHPTYPLIKQIGEGLRRFADRPVMLAWGLQDFCFSAHFLTEWKTRFPEAEVHAYSDAGHYLLEEKAEVLVPLMRNFILRSSGKG